jgi:hypothetical protein
MIYLKGSELNGKYNMEGSNQKRLVDLLVERWSI